MTTASKIIDAAVEKVAVSGSGVDLSARDSTSVLNSLNTMLHSWKNDGIDLNHVDLKQSDTAQFPRDHDRAVIYNLAVEIAPDFEVTLRPEVYRTAQKTKLMLEEIYSTIEEASLSMPIMPSQRFR